MVSQNDLTELSLLRAQMVLAGVPGGIAISNGVCVTALLISLRWPSETLNASGTIFTGLKVTCL